MGKSRNKSTALAILGMHRSGTSMITRVVNLLGAFIGEEKEVPWADSYNPEGYWEHERITLFHERVLEALGRTWDTTLALPSGWESSSELAPFREELTELIETRFIGQPLWAWKDPRTSVLLPLWKDVLAPLNVSLCCLLIARNPMDVARSLESRDGFSKHEGLGVWLHYNLAMLRNSESLPRAIVSYQRFLEDPAASLAIWGPRLSLPALPKDESRREKILQAIQRDLCHSASTIEDLIDDECPGAIIDLARILDDMAITGNVDAPAYRETIRKHIEAHSSFSILYSRDFNRAEVSIRDLQAQRNDLEQTSAAAQARIDKQTEQLVYRQSVIENARAKVGQLEERLSNTQSKLTQAEDLLVNNQNLLDEARNRIADTQRDAGESQKRLESELTAREVDIGNLREHMQQITGSCSWRLTLPFRSCRNAMNFAWQKLCSRGK